MAKKITKGTLLCANQGILWLQPQIPKVSLYYILPRNKNSVTAYSIGTEPTTSN
jgi:hypothetical protein